VYDIAWQHAQVARNLSPIAGESEKEKVHDPDYVLNNKIRSVRCGMDSLPLTPKVLNYESQVIYPRFNILTGKRSIRDVAITELFKVG